VSPSTWTFVAKKRETSVAIHSRLIVNTAEAAIDAAVAGLGITRVLSYQIENEIRTGKLHALLRDLEPPPWPVSLVFAGQRLLPQKLRAFVDFSVPRLRATLARSAIEDAHHKRPKRRTARRASAVARFAQALRRARLPPVRSFPRA